MKKLFIFSFILSSTLGFGQKDSLDFILEYLPNKTYMIESKSFTTMELRYSGSEEVLETLKAQGVKNPQITQEKETTQYIITTGEKAENKFPISLKISYTENSDLKDLLFEGYCKEKEYPTLTSIKSSTSNKEEEKIILESVQSFFKQSPIINKKLKIDDNYSFSFPLKLPIGGINMEILLTTNYILKKIKNNQAFFDYTQIYSMKISEKENNITGKGKGKGKIIYDIKQHSPISNIGDSSIQIEIKKYGIQMLLKMDRNTNETTKIN